MPSNTPLATTGGELRQLLSQLPAAAPIVPVWHDGPPSDSDPTVIIHGVAVTDGQLQLHVGIQYLDEFEPTDLSWAEYDEMGRKLDEFGHVCD